MINSRFQIIFYIKNTSSIYFRDHLDQLNESSEKSSSQDSSLPQGWRKVYIQRKVGKTAGKYDAYIYRYLLKIYYCPIYRLIYWLSQKIVPFTLL